MARPTGRPPDLRVRLPHLVRALIVAALCRGIMKFRDGEQRISTQHVPHAAAPTHGKEQKTVGAPNTNDAAPEQDMELQRSATGPTSPCSAWPSRASPPPSRATILAATRRLAQSQRAQDAQAARAAQAAQGAQCAQDALSLIHI